MMTNQKKNDIPIGKIQCICGSVLNKSGKSAHIKTKKHLLFIQEGEGKSDEDREIKIPEYKN